jgi:hypothetical protein
VSRIPVREALVILENEGRVRLEHHRGAFVLGMDAESVVDNAENWAATPTVALKEPDPDELDRVGSQADALASREVDQLLQNFTSRSNTFRRTLDEAQDHLRRLRADGGPVDDGTSQQQRMGLADMAVGLREGHQELRARIRHEMRS